MKSDNTRYSTTRTRNRVLVSRLIRAWHSTHRQPPGWRVAFLLKRNGVTVGVSTWGRPVARMEDQKTTLEHQRMALGPGLPHNTASWWMAQNRREIARIFPEVRRLISYVDETVHSGVTYRADNWQIVYRSRVEKKDWSNRPGRVQPNAVARTKFQRLHVI